MPEKDNTARVVNKSGTLKMTDETAARHEARNGGRHSDRRGNRRGRRMDNAPKEFDEVTISIDRVSRTVAGGRRMRFKALVAIGDHKNRVGVGVAKGNDVTTAVQKASSRARKNLITFAMDGETICHETETKSTAADVLMKPAAPGTGIIAGGTVRSIIGLTGIKNLISKSLGSTNKVNVAYAVIEGLRQQVPKSEWTRGIETSKAEKTKQNTKGAKTSAKSTKSPAKPAEAAKKPAQKSAKSAKETTNSPKEEK